MIERWTSGEFDVVTVWNLGITDAPDTLYELIPDLHTRYVGFSRRQAAVLEQARPQGLRARGRPRGAPTRRRTASAPRPAAARSRPRCPATPTASGPSTTPRPRAQLLAEAGYPEGRGPPRAQDARPALAHADREAPGRAGRRDRVPPRLPRGGRASSGRRASRTSTCGSAASAPTTPTRTASSAGSSASRSRSTATTRSRR